LHRGWGGDRIPFTISGTWPCL